MMIKMYIIVDAYTRDILYEDDDKRIVRQALKERYPEDVMLCAVCEEYDDGNWSPYSVGLTMADAKKNFKKGIIDNYEDFV